MDSPRNRIDKWMISMPEALLFFLLVVLAIVGFCTSAILRRKKIQREQLGDQTDVTAGVTNDVLFRKQPKQSDSDFGPLKAMIRPSACSEASNGRVTTKAGERSRWDSGGSRSIQPLWQKRVLMGERCELPRFSGLILYDALGRPLCNSSRENTPHQEKLAPVVTTLMDLV